MMDGKPLSICGACGCDPCDCHGAVPLVRLTYYVDEDKFTIFVPQSLVEQYKSLYARVEMMQPDGSMVVYNSVVAGSKRRIKGNENK